MTRQRAIKFAKGQIEAYKTQRQTTGTQHEFNKVAVKELERLEKIEALVNDPLNRAKGSVSIRELREVIDW